VLKLQILHKVSLIVTGPNYGLYIDPVLNCSLYTAYKTVAFQAGKMIHWILRWWINPSHAKKKIVEIQKSCSFLNKDYKILCMLYGYITQGKDKGKVVPVLK
jgi:hypothetical protein